MFSVIFPGQGSQVVGMGKDLHDKFEIVKNLFKEADEILNFSISKLIFRRPERRARFNNKYTTCNIFA